MSFAEPSYAVNQPARGNVINGIDRILSMPRARVYRAAAFSVVSATQTAVSWDTRDYDTDGMWSTSTADRLTMRTAGVYLFTTQSGWGTTAGGSRQMWIAKGVSANYGLVVVPDATGLGVYLSTHAVLPMNAGDYVVVGVYQNSGGAMNWDTGNNGLTATLLSTL